jgi:endo-1,4-beta-xylanase
LLESPAVLGVLTWDLSDRRSWLNDVLPRTDKLPQRQLPLDADLKRKPMWTAMAEAFDNAADAGLEAGEPISCGAECYC